MKGKVTQSCWTFVTPWTIQSIEFSRPEYWSGCTWPSLGFFPSQGSNPGFLHCRRILYKLSHKGSSEKISICGLVSLLTKTLAVFTPCVLNRVTSCHTLYSIFYIVGFTHIFCICKYGIFMDTYVY